MQKALYYGYGGACDLTDQFMPQFDDDLKYVFTHLAASYFYCGTDAFHGCSMEALRYPVSFVAFDCIYIEGKELICTPLMDRKEQLSRLVNEDSRIAVSRYVEGSGTALYMAAEASKLEGVVAKRKDSFYLMGKRTKDWIKFKRMADEDFVVAGYIKKGGHMYSLVLARIHSF